MSDLVLLRLALIAIDDAEARPALVERLEETGWDDARAWALATRVHVNAFDTSFAFVDEDERRHRPAALRRPGPWLARAVAAVLLFGDWPRSWELAAGCRRAPEAPRTPVPMLPLEIHPSGEVETRGT